MRTLICSFLLIAASRAQQTSAEKLIEEGHWKRARVLVEGRAAEAQQDPRACFLLSQVRAAFGDRSGPLPLAERAVVLDPRTAKYHRQVAEVVGMAAQQAGPLQQLFLARRFRKEIEIALSLDAQDVQALRDLLEFYLLAPGIAGGDRQKAKTIAQRIHAIDAAEGFLADARTAQFEKRTGDAETALEQAAAVRPVSYRAAIELARYDLSAQPPKPSRAEAAAREAMRLYPDRADAYAILSAIYACRASIAALDEILVEAARRVPDDAFPYYSAAERLVADQRDLDRAQHYLLVYMSQEPEGNRPTLADARRLLSRIPAVSGKGGRTGSFGHAGAVEFAVP